MSELPFATLSLDEMVESVATNLRRRSDQPGAAYTLLLGGGMSVPLVPTATQMVRSEIPRWLREKEQNPQPTEPPSEDSANDDGLDGYARDMWAQVKRQTEDKFDLSDDGVPDAKADNIGKAYQALMRGKAYAGLHTPALQREYIRDVVRDIGRQMNMGHVALASILREQHRAAYKQRFRRSFCRTIFTTNFDTLLQRGLQLVNQLYFMTDQPEQGITPPDDDADDAIHLIYTHGSTHRYFLANTASELGRLAQMNTPALTRYFERHGVIVIGYGGWPDTTMEALKACSRFDGNLYWCDIHSPQKAAGGGLRAEVVELLRHDKNNRFYVPLSEGGADDALLRLHKGLGLGTWPSVLFDPLEGLVEELEGIALPDKAGRASRRSSDRDHEQRLTGRSVEDADRPHDTLGRTLVALKEARNHYFSDTIASTEQSARTGTAATIAILMNLAIRSALDGEVSRAINLWSHMLDLPDAPGEQKAKALINRGVAYGQRGEEGDLQRAIDDFTAVLALPDAPAEQKANALINHGVAYGRRGKEGDLQRAIDDFSALIALRDAPAEQKATALYNRGVAYRQRGEVGDLQREIDDYSAALDLPDAPAEQKADALLNRGFTYRQRGEEGDFQRAIDDYSAAFDLPDAPTEEKAKALINRGVTYGTRGEEGDLQRAIDDYAAVLDLPDAPVEQKAGALLNRGYTYRYRGEEGDLQRAADDYSAVLALPDAPAEQKAGACFNLACVRAVAGDVAGAVQALEQWLELAPDTRREKLDHDPDFDHIRDSPAFVEFRRKLPE
ncbi:MAG: SIR2 family protein [Phycisphaeraceae bacterium]